MIPGATMMSSPYNDLIVPERTVHGDSTVASVGETGAGSSVACPVRKMMLFGDSA